MIIDKDMVVSYVIEKHPSTVRVFNQYGINISAEGILVSALSDINLKSQLDVDDLVDELNMAATTEQGRSGMVTSGL